MTGGTDQVPLASQWEQEARDLEFDGTHEERAEARGMLRCASQIRQAPLASRAPEVTALLKTLQGLDLGLPRRSGGDVTAVLIAWFEANGYKVDGGA